MNKTTLNKLWEKAMEADDLLANLHEGPITPKEKEVEDAILDIVSLVEKEQAEERAKLLKECFEDIIQSNVLKAIKRFSEVNYEISLRDAKKFIEEASILVDIERRKHPTIYAEHFGYCFDIEKLNLPDAWKTYILHNRVEL